MPQSFTQFFAHLIFSTKDREPFIRSEIRDDLHAYLASARRVRRLNAAYMEGLYFPSFSVGVVPMPGGEAAGATSTASTNPKTVTPKRSGWELMEIRPLRSSWRVLALQDVLTPSNAVTPLFPEAKDRAFGSWGLSFASDRWDLRRALVLESTYKSPSEELQEIAKVVIHVDLQTMAPLYYQSWDARGEVVDVGMFVGRWSEDRSDYPKWPDDEDLPVRVIDPAGAAFSNVSERSAWRRESWTAVSTPASSRDERNKVSVQGLTKGR
jgi:hypothetical protein